ncbi:MULTISPECIES: hypothetical protein [Acinetobacter]|uniref:Uncharacterized protein n=1 Tax=Acinetobacter piscicola TaxID=2006115 RepID=A0A7S6VX02_9GAMM|nr:MULTISPECIES: hypothetical protein [Acinetobacter]QOW46454.1 hypothetical protein G0028_11410 [Acinetobacter piscicola]
MNDFFLAENRTYSVELDEDSSVELRQFIVGEIDKIEVFAYPIRKALKKDWATEDLHTVVDNNQIAATMLLESLSNLTFEAASKIKDAAPDKFIEIFEMLLIVNKTYFEQDEVKKNNKNDDKFSWFDSFQTLISKGHKHEDILNYSFGAFMEYLKAAQRHEQNHILSRSVAMRVAYHADKKGFSSYTNEVNKD